MAEATRRKSAKGSGSTYDPRFDEQIAAAPIFARPILTHLRAVVHEAEPEATEAIKWSRPFFVYQGEILCMMSAFTKHCSFGFWSPEMTQLLSDDGVDGMGAAGSFGRIEKMADLPDRKALTRYVQHAATLIREGKASSAMAARPRASAKPAIAVPEELAAALKKSAAAAATFAAFSPSCRREYLEWITTAKRPETRERRVVQTVSRLEAGKRYNDEYR